MRDLITRHKIFFGTIIFLVFLVIPLTVFQVQQQQELRQRAGGGDVPLLKLSPLTDSKHPNDSFYVDVILENPMERDISAVEFTLSSSNDNIKIIVFKPSSSYQELTNTNNDSSIQFTGINTAESPIISRNIPLGRLTLGAFKIGDSKLSFSNITVTASLSQDPLSTSSQDGSYSIIAKTASAPTKCGDIECPSGFSCDRNNSTDPFCVANNPTPTGIIASVPQCGGLGENCCASSKCKTGYSCAVDNTCEQVVAVSTPTPTKPPTLTPTPTVFKASVCTLETLQKGALSCFTELYKQWKADMKIPGKTNILYFNKLKNKYLGK